MEESIKALEGIFELVQKLNMEKLKDFEGTPRCEVLAKSIMTRNVVGIEMESSLWEAAELLLGRNISSVLALDVEGFVSGVFSNTDLARFYQEKCHGKSMSLEDLEQEKVADWMNSELQTVDVLDTLETIASKMLSKKVHRVFVKSEDEIVGVVSAIDLVTVFSPGPTWEEKEEPELNFYPRQSERLRLKRG